MAQGGYMLPVPILLQRVGGYGTWGVALVAGRVPGTVVVESVVKNSVAHACGLVKGDQILTIDGMPVQQMQGRVTAYFSGNSNSHIALSVQPAGPSPPQTKQLELARKKQKDAWGFEVIYNPAGFFILASVSKSKAAGKAGARLGDKLVAIGGNAVPVTNNVEEIYGLIRGAGMLNLSLQLAPRELWGPQIPMPVPAGAMQQVTMGVAQMAIPVAQPYTTAAGWQGPPPEKQADGPTYDEAPPAYPGAAASRPGLTNPVYEDSRGQAGPTYEDAGNASARPGATNDGPVYESVN